jgi:hypothetical protein
LALLKRRSATHVCVLSIDATARVEPGQGARGVVLSQ